jgi:phenylacetic acid degradation protein paaN
MANATASRATDWLLTHRSTLDTARETIRTRAFWSAYPEIPSGKVYGETAAADGKAAFDARLGKTFDLGQPGATGKTVSPERSPYGLALNVAYPVSDIDVLVETSGAAILPWAEAGIDARTGVALEMLARLNKNSFEIANAVMHTTGQPFMMSFQAGGPHAQDRALEAVAYAYDEMSRVPARALWEKPQGKAEPLRIEKTFSVVPRGIDLTIGCSTFPNWNSYPGMFASLVTGNTVIVKPHPQAVLPLAISVEIMRATLRDAGFDPNIVMLAVDTVDAPIAKELATMPGIALIDYTGSSTFGNWLEKNTQAQVYTEKAGVNSVVIDSTADFKGMTRNLAMSLSLYSGQMCTTPQNVFVPKSGIETDEGHKSFDEVVSGIVGAIDGLLGPVERAVEILGAIAVDGTLTRLDAENEKAHVVRKSTTLAHPNFPDARVRTPLIATMDAEDGKDVFMEEMFGPIAYIVATESTPKALGLLGLLAATQGAITAIVHSTNPDVIALAEQTAAIGNVSLAINLTGSLLVNQSAAFSDFHVSGGNPSGNASLTDAAFVANRFRVIETRRPAAN